MSGLRMMELREFLKLSQQEFAAQIGITQGALSQLEAQKSKLSLDTLSKISRTFGVDCNWLVTGESDVFMDPAKIERYREKKTMDHKIKREGFIPLVRGEAHAGYIENYEDDDFLGKLDVYRIPGYETGDCRLFEVEGTSMIPTIYPAEIVIAERVPDFSMLANGILCVVVTQKGIVAKRVYLYEEDSNVLILKSDNHEFKTYTIALDEVIEIWHVRAKITNVFAQNYGNDTSKIKELEDDISILKKQMSRLSGEMPIIVKDEPTAD